MKKILAAAAVIVTCGAWLRSAAAEEATLILATALPPGNPLAAQVLHPWAERVNAAGKGSLRIDVRDGMTIANLSNSLDRVLADVAQISWLTHNNFSGKFERSNVGGLPFVTEESEQASVAMWRLYKSGMLNAEYEDVQPIMIAVLSQAGVHLRKAPASIDNLQGLKVIVPSKTVGDVASRIGMSPIALPVTQTYEALQRGTVDGVVLGWTAVQSFKLEEVTFYHAEAALGTSPGMLFIAKKRYAALAADARKALDERSGEGESRELGKFWGKLDVFGRTRIGGMEKQTVTNVPPEVVARWRQLAEPVVAEWTRTTPDGEKVLAAFRAELAKVKAGQ